MARIPDLKSITTEDEYIHVRFRDPDEFDEIRTPDWAENAASDVAEGAEVRTGKLKDEDDWLLAGVHSNTSNDGLDPEAPLGDIGVATRVSSYTDWIFRNTAQKQQVRAEDTEPPSREEVPTKVEEGKGVYFLVEIPGGAARPSSVDFFTRDGTAEAGLDYIPTSGEIEFEQGDKWAKVWVQTLADSQMEGEEDFELVLTNPEGADFPDGKTELSASRNISEKDVQLTGVTELSPELFGDVA